MTLLDKINEEIERMDYFAKTFPLSKGRERYAKTIKALKASREFFEKTMEAEYGEDIGEIMQAWDEAVGGHLE